MALSNMGLGFVFTAKDLASGTMNKLDSKLTGLGNTSKKAGQAMRTGFGIAAAGIAPFAAGVAGVATSMQLASASEQFSQGVRRVGNISGATTEQLNKLRDAAVEAGLRTQFSPDESVEGLANLAAQGFKTEESITLLNSSLSLAAGGQIGISDATKTTASAMRVFGLRADEGAEATDKLLKITNMTSLQAGDLALALGTVSRGAGLTKQNLDEMLISMGLVRNTGVEASVAARSVSTALQFAAKNAEDFKKELDVDIVDEQTGQFRDFLDIIGDASQALDEKFTDAGKKATAALELFGRFGITSFQGVSSQLKTMIEQKDGINNMEEAIASMRKEMEGAKGTAEEFANSLLDTLAGQKKILGGAAETLAVVLGEPFAKVFKPIVSAISGVVSGLARFMNSLSENTRTVIAAFFLFTSVSLLLAGALAIVVGLLIVISPFMVAIFKFGLLFFGLFAGIMAMIAATAGVVAAGIKAARENIGGFGDFIEDIVTKVKLAWNGLKEIFATGGFVSGDILKEENKKVLSFVSGIFAIGFRLQKFFEGFMQGFEDQFSTLGPAFEGLQEAFVELATALGLMADRGKSAATGIPSEAFAKFGARVAKFVVNVLRNVIGFIQSAIEFTQGFAEGLENVWMTFRPVFEKLFEAFRSLGAEIEELFLLIGVKFDDGGDAAKGFGSLVGNVFGGIITIVAKFVTAIVNAVAFMVHAANAIMRAWNAVMAFFETLGARISLVFMNVVDTIMNVADKILGFISKIISKIPDNFKPDSLKEIEQLGANADQRIAVREQTGRQRERLAEQQIATIERGTEQGQARQQRSEREEISSDIAAAIEQTRREERDRNMNLVLQIDGETIAQKTVEADRKEAARGFVPGVPTEVE